jgi:glycosyltransferase involved in cell wall biosynthesis
MRILHVIGTLNPTNGGPPEAVRQFVRAYSKIGVDVEVACQNSPSAPFLAGVACPVHALGERRLGRFGFSPRLWRWLHRNASRFDGIVMNGLWVFADIAVRDAARRAGIPYAVFPHGSLDPWFNKKYPLKHLKKLFYWPLQYPVLRDARAVLFTTTTERDLAADSFRPNHWNGIPVAYGVSDPGGNPAAQIEAFHAKIPALAGRRYLLFMARLHEKKGCDLLVEAFAPLAAQFPDVDLVVAGPDLFGLQATLRELAVRSGVSARVHWPGMLTGDLKWGALRAAEAFILPSHQENFGIVVVESLAAGRPVLITNKVNIWPEVQNDGAALVEDDTLDGTERLLRRWLTLPAAEREAMAAKAWPCFAAHFSMDRAAAAIRDLFAAAKKSPAAEPAKAGPVTALAGPGADRTPPAARIR